MGTTTYEIEIEIVKGDHCDHHRVGETYRYPEEIGNICPWFMDSINSMVRVLQFGGTLPWTYKHTEFEKQIDDNGITTEFIRCPDPTKAGIVAKITRRKLLKPKTVEWT